MDKLSPQNLPPFEESPPLSAYEGYDQSVDQYSNDQYDEQPSQATTAPAKYAVDFEPIKNYCSTNVLSLVQQWLSDGKTNGKEYLAFSPFRSEKNPSLSINLTTGKWSDFAGEHKGKEITSLYHAMFGTGREYRDSMIALGLAIGIGVKEYRHNGKKKKFENFFSTPPIECWLGPELNTHKPTSIFDYQDFNGNSWKNVAKVYRFDIPNHKKEIRQLRTEKDGWMWGGMGENRPLYNLQAIVDNPDKPVMVCEGEPAADAIKELLPDFVGTTPMQGAKSPHKTNWEPLVGREVWIWPDNDNAGQNFAATVYEILESKAKSIHILKPPPKKPPKWDAADVLKERNPDLPFSQNQKKKNGWGLQLPFSVVQELIKLYSDPVYFVAGTNEYDLSIDEIGALRVIQEHTLPSINKDNIPISQEIAQLIDEDLLESQLENADKFSKEQVDTLLWELSKLELPSLRETDYLDQIKEQSDFKINTLKRGLKEKRQGDIEEASQEITTTYNEKDFYKVVSSGNNVRFYLLDQSVARDVYLENYTTNLLYGAMTEDWYKYDNGVWRCVGKNIIRKQLDNVITQNLKKVKIGFTSNWLNGLLDLLQNPLATRDWDIQPNHFIPFKNGILNLKTKELSPHNPDYHYTWQLPYDYKPEATCQPIIDWLHESVNGDENQVQVLRAYLYAVLTGLYNLERYVEIIGDGGAGKSTFAWLCESLVGTENTKATDFKSLESNRFEMSSFYGKRLIVLADEGKFAGKVANFKKITGRDKLRYEDKHKSIRGDKSRDFVYKGMVLVIANQAIKSDDYTSGLARRRLTFYFKNNPNKIRDLKGENGEFKPLLSGFVNWVLALPQTEAENLLWNGDKIIDSLISTRLDNLEATNPMFGWLNDNCAYDPDGFTPTGRKIPIRISEGESEDGSTSSRSHTEYKNQDTELYPNFCAWCDSQGKKPNSLNDFGRLLEDLCQRQLGLTNVIRKPTWKNGKTYKGFKGLILNSEISFAESANMTTNDDIDCELDI
jgi:phage/plasmid-associated DNA primase